MCECDKNMLAQDRVSSEGTLVEEFLNVYEAKFVILITKKIFLCLPYSAH